MGAIVMMHYVPFGQEHTTVTISEAFDNRVHDFDSAVVGAKQYLLNIGTLTGLVIVEFNE